MKILVCGGRDFADRRLFDDAFGDIFRRYRPSRVIQGGASGADEMARDWCCRWNFPYEHYPAEWKKHGKAAGPIRNQRMIDEGKPDLVVAFPGGRGTADMLRRAKDAGVPIIEVPA